jgi:hypothetical protein
MSNQMGMKTQPVGLSQKEVLKAAQHLYVYMGYTFYEISNLIGIEETELERFAKKWKRQRKAYLKLPESIETRVERLLSERVTTWEHGRPHTLQQVLAVQNALVKVRSSFEMGVMILNAFELFLNRQDEDDSFQQRSRAYMQQFLAELKLSMVSQGGKIN